MEYWIAPSKAKPGGEAVDPLDEKHIFVIPPETPICMMLDTYPNRTARAREVAREIEVSPREVRDAFAKWQRVGRIRKNPDGSYTLKREYAESADCAVLSALARIAVRQHGMEAPTREELDE